MLGGLQLALVDIIDGKRRGKEQVSTSPDFLASA